MLKELKEKLIKEVRVDTLYDSQSGAVSPAGWANELRTCVTVEALLVTASDMKMGFPPIYGHFEQETFHNPNFFAADWESVRATNREKDKEIRERLERRGFRVMSGHFVEVSNS